MSVRAFPTFSSRPGQYAGQHTGQYARQYTFVKYACLAAVLAVASMMPVTRSWAQDATDVLCNDRSPPTIVIKTAEEETRFDSNHSTEDLKEKGSDTTSPFPSSFHTDIGGLIENQLSLGHGVAFAEIEKSDGARCLYIDHIEVTLRMAPVIHIASDLQNKPCWYAEVFDHETKHLEIDRALLADQKTTFRDNMLFALTAPTDYAVRLTAADDSAVAKTYMDENITRTLKVLFDSLLDERRFRQQALDSLGEYARINFNCRLKPANFPRLHRPDDSTP